MRQAPDPTDRHGACRGGQSQNHGRCHQAVAGRGVLGSALLYKLARGVVVGPSKRAAVLAHGSDAHEARGAEFQGACLVLMAKVVRDENHWQLLATGEVSCPPNELEAIQVGKGGSYKQRIRQGLRPGDQRGVRVRVASDEKASLEKDARQRVLIGIVVVHRQNAALGRRGPPTECGAWPWGIRGCRRFWCLCLCLCLCWHFALWQAPKCQVPVPMVRLCPGPFSGDGD